MQRNEEHKQTNGIGFGFFESRPRSIGNPGSDDSFIIQREREKRQRRRRKELLLIESQKTEITIGNLELSGMAIVFGMFLKEAGREFIKHVGHYFLFPIVVGLSCCSAIESWRQAKLADYKKGTWQRAVVNTLAAAAFVTAVVGGAIWEAAHVLLSPIIFVAALAVKTLFHSVAALYYTYKSRTAKTSEEAAHYKPLATANTVASGLNLAFTAAVALVMIAHIFTFGLLGVAAAIVGIGYGIFYVNKKLNEKRNALRLEGERDRKNSNEFVSSSRRLQQVFPSSSPKQTGENNRAKIEFDAKRFTNCKVRRAVQNRNVSLIGKTIEQSCNSSRCAFIH
ncbi:MAG: hypothetical protein ACD_60C00006G0007 [uncultured bacterium]|nr:MAG: hypothetical protein ACD_60C00006G0007 [uncultured bacterium]